MTDKKIAALVAFAEFEARCPYCSGIYACTKTCTPDGKSEFDALDYDRMMAARAALNTKET